MFDAVQLQIEMILGSVKIVRTARDLGYLDENLRLTGKKLDASDNGSARGFQTQVVQCLGDITDEVEFLEGLDNWAMGKILESLKSGSPYKWPQG